MKTKSQIHVELGNSNQEERDARPVASLKKEVDIFPDFTNVKPTPKYVKVGVYKQRPKGLKYKKKPKKPPAKVDISEVEPHSEEVLDTIVEEDSVQTESECEFDSLGFPVEFGEFVRDLDNAQDDWTVVERRNKSEPETTAQRLERKTRMKEMARKIEDLEEHFDVLDIGRVWKQSNEELYQKHRGGRYNSREKRRHELRQRLKRRNERLARNKVVPHGLEDDYPEMCYGPNGTTVWKDIDRSGMTEEVPNVIEARTKAKEYEPVSGLNESPVASDEDFTFGVKSEVSEQFDDASESASSRLSKKTQERNDMARAAVEVTGFTGKTDKKLASLLKSVGSVESFAEGIEQGKQIDEWIGHLENLVILGYQMYTADSFMDVFMAVAAYAKMYCKQKSIVMELFRIIDEVTVTCETDEVEPHGWEDWSGREILMKWDLFKTNTIFKKVSYLISAAMSLTVCTTKKVEWSPFGLQLISLEAAKEQLKAVDVIDALVKTFVWMCEVGWRCFETRSIAPILYSDVRVQEYNEECDYVLAKADAALAGNVEDLGAYETKLNSVYKKTCTMKAAKNDGPTSLWLQKRYSELVAIMEKLAAKRKNTDIRFNPFGISLHGGTGVGKTTLGKLTMTQSLATMGFCDDSGVVDDSRIITMDMFDKYQSTWTTDILGVFMDDIGNAKAEFQKDNPHTSVIIKFFNNVAAQAIKAELNAKGVVFIDFKVGVVTSNVKDLDARCYSNCPESILRRFYHIEVKVKEKYRKKNTTMLNKAHPEIKGSESLIQDVWDLTIEEVETFEVGPNKTDYHFSLLEIDLDDGRTINCQNIGLKDYLDVIIQLSKNHKAEQDSLIAKSKASAKTKFCKSCKRFPEYCECKTEVVPHSVDMISEVVVEAGKTAVTNYINSWAQPVNLINSLVGFSPIKKMTTSVLAKEIQRELNAKGTPLFVAITPDWLYKTTTFQNTVYAWQSAAAYYDVRKPLRWFGLIGLSLVGAGAIKRNKALAATGVGSLWCTTVLGFFMHQVRVRQIQDAYLQKRDALPNYAKTIRDGKFPKGVLFAATLALGVKIISMWNNNRLETDPNGLTPDEIEASPGWFGYMMTQIGWKAESSVTGATPDHVLKTGKKNQGWAHITRSDGSETGCNIVYPKKGICWYPKHVFYPRSDMTKDPVDYIDVKVYRDKDKSTSIFKFRAELGGNTVYLDHLDMVATFVERCPDLRNSIIKFLPITHPTGTSVSTIMSRNKEAELSHENVTVTHGQFGHKYMKMYGGNYTTSKAGNGACMSMLVAEGKNPVIVGFHIGGSKAKRYGVMMTVTQKDALDLENKLLELPGVRGMAECSELPDTQYGRRILESDEVHPNSKFIKELTPEAAVDVLGSAKLRAEVKSRVVPSVLEKDARELFSITNHWGAPRLKANWKAFNATLQHVIDPSDMFTPSALQRARRDYVASIIKFAEELNKKEGGIKPLNDHEMLCGIAGKSMMTGVVMNTSIGEPLMGPKSRHVEEVREGEKLITRTVSPQVKAEMNRLYQCWKEGRRAYPIFSATLKDEPTPVDKEKVRVFQAAPFALGLYIRKYFLPIVRILSLCPELSECAVGVNAFGLQWEKLMEHAEKFASDNRVVAWDFSKFDVRMNAQMTYAAFMCMIDIAEVLEYSSEDLQIMKYMIADIIHPLMNWNGTMLMAYNMNTSGNNVTVNVNSIVNSLYVRLGFFHCCPEVADFRKAVAALTYGDDFKGSVAPQYRDRFNFITFKKFLADYGIKITEPNKSDQEHEDLHTNDADFLKRQSNFIPEIGHAIGKLDKDSMYKPLCANLKSSTESPKSVAMSCVDTYMHELFAHGREEYEHDQPLMKELCVRVFDTVLPSVNFTFDERVAMWKEKYL